MHKIYWWLVEVTLVLVSALWPNFWEDGGDLEMLCHSVNVDGVIVLFGGGGDTSILDAEIKLVPTFSTQAWWEHENLDLSAFVPPNLNLEKIYLDLN